MTLTRWSGPPDKDPSIENHVTFIDVTKFIKLTASIGYEIILMLFGLPCASPLGWAQAWFKCWWPTNIRPGAKHGMSSLTSKPFGLIFLLNIFWNIQIVILTQSFVVVRLDIFWSISRSQNLLRSDAFTKIKPHGASLHSEVNAFRARWHQRIYHATIKCWPDIKRL